MHNRGIEIALLAKPFPGDTGVLFDFHKLPADIPYRGQTAIDFASIKRALGMPNIESSSLCSPSGRALDHFSSLATLVDHAPLVLKTSESLEDATYHFASRSIAPATTPMFLRYLLAQTSAIEATSLFSTILTQVALVTSSFREGYCRSHRRSSNHILAQCMDFHLNNPSPSSSEMHLMVLNALQLVVALAMDSNSQQPPAHSSAAGGRGGERLRQTRMVIDSLIKVNIVATRLF
ncbi:AAA ATPase midasin [Stygiomarasmius scandens]|uniref:AAA ATPase midasin n=1 Tax=Marasmiellus scandens TaxID=2682957 RepID=A0ABR1IMD2_9AGAR